MCKERFHGITQARSSSASRRQRRAAAPRTERVADRDQHVPVHYTSLDMVADSDEYSHEEEEEDEWLDAGEAEDWLDHEVAELAAEAAAAQGYPQSWTSPGGTRQGGMWGVYDVIHRWSAMLGGVAASLPGISRASEAPVAHGRSDESGMQLAALEQDESLPAADRAAIRAALLEDAAQPEPAPARRSARRRPVRRAAAASGTRRRTSTRARRVPVRTAGANASRSSRRRGQRARRVPVAEEVTDSDSSGRDEDYTDSPPAPSGHTSPRRSRRSRRTTASAAAFSAAAARASAAVQAAPDDPGVLYVDDSDDEDRVALRAMQSSLASEEAAREPGRRRRTRTRTAGRAPRGRAARLAALGRTVDVQAVVQEYSVQQGGGGGGATQSAAAASAAGGSTPPSARPACVTGEVDALLARVAGLASDMQADCPPEAPSPLTATSASSGPSAAPGEGCSPLPSRLGGSKRSPPPITLDSTSEDSGDDMPSLAQRLQAARCPPASPAKRPRRSATPLASAPVNVAGGGGGNSVKQPPTPVRRSSRLARRARRG